jgi:hypothetical protein
MVVNNQQQKLLIKSAAGTVGNVSRTHCEHGFWPPRLTTSGPCEGRAMTVNGQQEQQYANNDMFNGIKLWLQGASFA